MLTTPAFRAAALMRSASATSLASGFSHRIALPASAAATAISACESPGVTMSTTSMSLRPSTSCQRVAASSKPSRPCASFTFASVRPTTTFSTGSKGTSSKKRATCRQAFECARPMKSYPIIATFSLRLAIVVFSLSLVSPWSSRAALGSRPVGDASPTLHRDPLRWQHLGVERVHAGRGLVDLAGKGDRALEDGLEAHLVLDASASVLLLDHQRRVGHVQLQQLARRELVVEPVDR